MKSFEIEDSINLRLKWQSLIPVAPFHTELMASNIFVVAVSLAVVIVIIYLFVGSFGDPEQGGELSLRKLDAIGRRNFIVRSYWISGKGF